MGMLFIHFLWFSVSFLWGSMTLTDLESDMVSFDRCLKVTQIPQEDSQPYEAMMDGWPTQGKIEFKNFYLRYRPDTELVLKDLTFTIQPKEKIGVVGRTGAGKSTICLALCRIVEADSGEIIIDGRNIANMNLDNLREQIAIIPQDPTLFEGTLRLNLDPENICSNKELKDLLIQASLQDLLLRDEKGLDQQIEEKGQNLSSGERQLICICRAILRQNKIVLMDEATANIDIKTEETIQKLINEKFSNSTVITIAHRLNTIIHSDKVLVLDKGCVAEFDTPSILLKDITSIFHSLVAHLSSEE
jgi:ATP-binding cassette, subfamily C (CFTR/MRP), member 1